MPQAAGPSQQEGGPVAVANPTGIPRSWTDYFPARSWDPSNHQAELVYDVLQHLSTPLGASLLLNTFWAADKSHIVCQIDYQQLISQCQCRIQDAVKSEAGIIVIQCLSVAATEHLLVVDRARTRQRLGPQAVDGYQGAVLVRLANVQDALISIRQLASKFIGKFRSLKGTVVRMTPIKSQVTYMSFVCAKCGTDQKQQFVDHKYEMPTRCPGQGCKARTFEANRHEAACEDWQKIRLQEILSTDMLQGGQVPKTVEIELTNDLVGLAVVGDVVTVFGEIKVLATGDQMGKWDSNGGGLMPGGPGGGGGRGPRPPKQQSLFLIYMDAQSVYNMSRARQVAADRAANTTATLPGQPQTQGGALIKSSGSLPDMPAFTQKDLEFIIRFSEQYGPTPDRPMGDQFRQLVHALCPGIYGHELVKAGLLLALMGGLRKNEDVPGRVPIRGDIHVLVLGDPGLGKSQLLQACAATAPRGLYVCGNTSSSAGLTVSVAKDPVTNDYVFEAGAVVLGDTGVCCVDEFDKMAGEHQALLEAMEQQEVSVAKAGMVATVPARTTILAAANPAEGHYNKAKSVAENLKMSPAMLSRFDLIFILMDRPDEMLDQCVTEHVLALHSGLAHRAEEAKQRMLEFSHTQAEPRLLLGSNQGDQAPPVPARRSLKERLRMGPSDNTNLLLPQALMRKYIAYARQFTTPTLSDEAKVTLQDFYMTLRHQVAPGASSPVTARQLESLVRLTEARARLDLRQVATRDDALDVIEIMKDALYDRFGGLDDVMLGTTDYTRTGTGVRGKGGGKAAEAGRFMERLRVVGGRQGRDTFASGELYALANEINLQVKDISAFLDQLNEAGDLLKAGGGQYRVRGIKTPAGGPGAGGSQAGTQAGSQLGSQINQMSQRLGAGAGARSQGQQAPTGGWEGVWQAASKGAQGVRVQGWRGMTRGAGPSFDTYDIRAPDAADTGLG